MEIVRRIVPPASKALAAAGVNPVLARVFASRGVASADELALDLATLPGFATMKGIADAATRLADAILRREKIVIIADYDADGATACAVGMRGLAAMGAVVDFLVPNRFEYGYGLTPEIVAAAAAVAPRLIVTVDNGIASHDGVTAAAERGIEVLITDHHLPAATLPAPALIVNPNQPGCAFPGKHLAGVGVIFYVLIATRAALRERGHFTGRAEPNLGMLLDLVALGTVADVVCLDRINRTLVAQGLARIRAGRAQPGIRALLAVAGRDPRRATGYDLGFVVGPRLNAAGRLSDMALGIRCLLADTEASAAPLAAVLDRLNRERRDVESTMQEEALVALEARALDAADADAYTLCLFHPDWHQGVVGIVAGRLKDRYHRPTIVFARGNGSELKGSGRSIPGFHLRDALDLAAKRAPGLAREVWRACLRRRLDHQRRRIAAVRRNLRGDRARAADLRRPRAHARLGRFARTGRARDRARQHLAHRSLGPGVPRPPLRRHLCRARPAHRGREPLQAGACPWQRTLRRDPVSACGPAAALDPGGLPPGHQRMARRSVAPARHRALAAGLTGDR